MKKTNKRRRRKKREYINHYNNNWRGSMMRHVSEWISYHIMLKERKEGGGGRASRRKGETTHRRQREREGERERQNQPYTNDCACWRIVPFSLCHPSHPYISAQFKWSQPPTVCLNSIHFYLAIQSKLYVGRGSWIVDRN